MTTPFLIADAAEVAIMSPLAEAAFGSYDLQVPEGIDIEDIHDFEAPGNELGYVARLSPQRATGIARRFIRADVAVNAKDDTDPDVIPESDVDRVLSEAESRVESEFFLESDITKAGLGAWIPYVDFNVGDIVNVRIFDIWVKLPVTRIEPIISEGDVVDWRVHVGGQLLSDDQAREVENATIQKELIQDRRDLAGIDAKATRAVKDAESALDAVNDADGVIQGLVKNAAYYSQLSHQVSAQSVAHSAVSIEYSEESHKYSQKSQEHSEASFAHSDAARIYSDAANSASQQSKQYSQQVQDLRPVIEQAASDAQTASEQSSQHSADSQTASEQSSIHSQAATDAAELSQESLRLAELARDAAETSRRDAESKRDEAEHARRAGFAAMTAASAAMAQAEQSRAEAEESRRLAENERAAAEDQRRLAETARSGAESARDTAEQKRAAAESERALAESARDDAEQKRANAFESREAAMHAYEDMQTLINEEQNELIAQIAQQQRDLAESNKGRVNQLQATKAGTTWPGIAIQAGRNTGTTWGFSLPDSRGALVHAEHFRRVSGSTYGITKFKENLLTPIAGGWFIDGEDEEYIRLTWGGVEANQVSIDKSQSAVTPAQTTWTQLASLTQTANFKATNGYLSLRVTWSAANRGSTYIIRIRANGQEIARKSSSSLGPLTFMGTGVRSQNLTVANVTLAAGKSVTVEAYCTAGSSSQRRIGSAALKGTWIETQ